MDTQNISILLAGFVAMIIGVVLIGVVASEEQQYVTKTNVVNESQVLIGVEGAGIGANSTEVYTLTNNPTGWQLEDCVITDFTMRMPNGTELVETTDYTLYPANGTFVMKNTSTTATMITPLGDLTGNLTYYSYDYCADSYVNIGWGRTMLNLVPGFFGLALLAMGIGLFYKVMKNEKLIDI